MNILSIVPRLPPAIDGLGDYALLLAQKLRQEFGIQTKFLVGESNKSESIDIDGFPIHLIDDHSSGTLCKQLSDISPEIVLLHYAGYGYAQRGCPTWLIQGLEQWKTDFPNASLMIMFHEIYAAGRPPWTSAFWLFPLQKQLAKQLLPLSDFIYTNKHKYAEILYNLGWPKHKTIPVLPVFSNVGESYSPSPLSTRKRQLIVFGSSANRRQVYQNAESDLKQACQQLNIEKILDIGAKVEGIPQALDNIPIIEMGRLSASEISIRFGQSLAGFLDYNPNYLAKSGIFAAYCAYGLLPINIKGAFMEIDGLKSGSHYAFVSSLKEPTFHNIDKQTIASNAYVWYQHHRLSVHANLLANYLI
jgi:hypothetical protein